MMKKSSKLYNCAVAFLVFMLMLTLFVLFAILAPYLGWA